MKTKITVLALLFVLCFCPIGVEARTNKVENLVALINASFIAQTDLSPAASPGVIVSVNTNFAGLNGFETAELAVEILANGSVLTVTLSGVTASDLPPNSILAEIKLVDESGQRNFVVVSDGGTGIDVEIDL